MNSLTAIKAALGGIGGGFNGAAKGATQNQLSNDNSTALKGFDNTTLQNDLAETGKAIDKAKKDGVLSDGSLKNIYGENINDDLIKAFSLIDTADFTYKKEAQEEYKNNDNMDGKEHIGVIAQQLEANPITSGTVERNENGDLEIKTGHLTAENTAAIAELSRRVLALEKAMEEKNGRN